MPMDKWEGAAAIILAREAQGDEPAFRMLVQMWAQAVQATFAGGPVQVAPDAFGPFERAGRPVLHASHVVRGPDGVDAAVEAALPLIHQLDENGQRTGIPVMTAYAVQEADHVRLDTDTDGVVQPLAAAAALRILVEQLETFGAVPASVEPRDG